jgi:hypothetical protein
MAGDVELKGKKSVVTFKEGGMSNKMTLVVRFHMDEEVKKEFTAKLQAVFTHIVKEDTFPSVPT